MTEVKVVYHGKFGVVTDLGEELLAFPLAKGNFTIPRYGVWKMTGNRHEVALTTNDLEAAKTAADADHDGAFEQEDRDSEKCAACGKRDYRLHMTEHEGKYYCDNDCAGIPEPADFCDVVKALRMTRPSASLQATGGGIDCIRVVVGKHGVSEYALYFGTANEKWGADVYTILANGDEDWGTKLKEEDSNVETDCSSEEPDAVKVAAAIHHAVKQFEGKLGEVA